MPENRHCEAVIVVITSFAWATGVFHYSACTYASLSSCVTVSGRSFKIPPE